MNMTSPPDLDGSPLELLIKIMKMTTASEDTIAVAAIRKANSHIAKLGTDWEALLRGKVKIIADPFANINIPQAAMNPNRNQPFNPAPQAPPRPQPAPSLRPAPPPPPRSQPSRVRPNPGSPGFAANTLERTIVNRFPGTCTKCKNRVETGDGIAKLWTRANSTTYWTSEHAGACPTPRRHGPATTADDFQV